MSRDGRRQFLAGVGALLAATCAAAQPSRTRIGLLASGKRAATTNIHGAFFDALKEKGWVEGENLIVERRYADGVLGRHDALARELVALNPQLIVAPTRPAVVAVRKLTHSIPIVFVTAQDPVGAGFAASLARPGGNATGLSTVNVELGAKRLALLKEAFPATRRVAMLYQPEFDVAKRLAAELEPAAKSIGLKIARVGIGGPATFVAALGMLDATHPDAIFVLESPALYSHRKSLVAQIAERRLPAMYGLQDFAIDGGLMAYSMSFVDQFRRAADYVDKILRGAKPGDLPIQQPTNFELVINMKTAKALGLTLSQSVLLRADRVIE